MKNITIPLPKKKEEAGDRKSDISILVKGENLEIDGLNKHPIFVGRDCEDQSKFYIGYNSQGERLAIGNQQDGMREAHVKSWKHYRDNRVIIKYVLGGEDGTFHWFGKGHPQQSDNIIGEKATLVDILDYPSDTVYRR
ncbi:hypothetical protein JW711_02070 [Candidatus Woesearchaeota archaeon]|nr:hypothetical protein [Candidatus Woesearchaeota archaeon]